MVLKKQQEDISSLTKHLDHVISFTKWATASNSGTALLYCKRLVSVFQLSQTWILGWFSDCQVTDGEIIFFLCFQILYQIQYLLRAKCNTSYVPQSSVRFQCRAAFWASNVDLGKTEISYLKLCDRQRLMKWLTDWWQFGWSSGKKLLRNGPKCRLCGGSRLQVR